MDKGFKTYAILLLWLAIACWIPSLIFNAEDISLCAIIAASIGAAIGIAITEHPDSKGFFAKELPFTCVHFWIFVAYAVVGMFMVGFGDIPYKDVVAFGKSIVFYAALPVPVSFIECFVKARIEKKKRMEQRIQRLYQVACSHQNLKMYFQGKVDRIEVEYKILYRSFAGAVNKEGSFTKNKEDVANFYIECPNPECTSGYIDLRTEVLNAVEEWETMVSGVTTCCGKTAPDHPNQKCDVQIEYSIQIQYSQP